MANERNLIPFDKRTKREQREIASQGGIASGEARRLKKSRQELLQTFLDGTYTDEQGNTLTGEELIERDIASILSNPDHKHFVKIFELLFSEKYDAELDKAKAETELTKAKTAQLKGEDKEIEDLSELYKLITN